MEFAFAQIWIICMMAFVFGPLIPIIFVYALVGLIILYVQLRVGIAYNHRRVPSYDNRSVRRMISGLPVLAFIYGVISARVFSNQQAFRNNVQPNKSHVWFFADADHHLKQAF